jgi:hypothetical protein
MICGLDAVGLSLWTIAEIGILLLIHLICSKRFIPIIDVRAASLILLSEDWLPAINYCS